MEPDSDVQRALQKRDIDDLREDMRKGFEQTHELQRLTNGRLLTAEKSITELEKTNIRRSIETRYNKFIWYIFTIALSAIVALSSYIIYHK